MITDLHLFISHQLFNYKATFSYQTSPLRTPLTKETRREQRSAKCCRLMELPISRGRWGGRGVLRTCYRPSPPGLTLTRAEVDPPCARPSRLLALGVIRSRYVGGSISSWNTAWGERGWGGGEVVSIIRSVCSGYFILWMGLDAELILRCLKE